MTAIAVPISEAADLLGVSAEVVRAAIDRKELPARRVPSVRGSVGTAIRVDVSALRAWFETWEEARP